MKIAYPDGREGFSIHYSASGYYVDGVANLDTAAMYTYLEQVSFLQVAGFQNEPPAGDTPPQLNISVQDASANQMTLTFLQSGFDYYAQIDSLNGHGFRPGDVLALMRGGLF